MEDLPLLSSLDMARFTARGFLRFDGVVPEEINAQFLAEAGEADYPKPGQKMMRTYGELLHRAQIPEVAAATDGIVKIGWPVFASRMFMPCWSNRSWMLKTSRPGWSGTRSETCSASPWPQPVE